MTETAEAKAEALKENEARAIRLAMKLNDFYRENGLVEYGQIYAIEGAARNLRDLGEQTGSGTKAV